MQKLARRFLRDLGHVDVDVASGGAEALRFMALVICDYQMSPMNGLQLLDEIRGDETLTGIPFVMLTGVGELELVRAAQTRGVAGFIVKPFTRATLQTHIEAALRKSCGLI
jgi:two-component system chemotaxis response regulator CheY